MNDALTPAEVYLVEAGQKATHAYLRGVPRVGDEVNANGGFFRVTRVIWCGAMPQFVVLGVERTGEMLQVGALLGALERG